MAAPSRSDTSSPKQSTKADRLEIGEAAASLLTSLRESDLVFLAADESRAEEVARAMQSAEPGACIVFCPGSDSLPGDSAPPSPANVGRRASALRSLRAAVRANDRGRIALIASGEAAARLYPPPASFEAAPPIVRIGDELELEAFAAELEAIG